VSSAGGTANMGASEFLVSNLVFAKSFKLPQQANVHSPAHHFDGNKNSRQIAQHTCAINLSYNF